MLILKLVIFIFFWRKFGLYLAFIWPLFGLYLAFIWPLFGLFSFLRILPFWNCLRLNLPFQFFLDLTTLDKISWRLIKRRKLNFYFRGRLEGLLLKSRHGKHVVLWSRFDCKPKTYPLFIIYFLKSTRSRFN